MTTKPRGLAAASLIAAALATLHGCAADGPARPLTADAFVRQRPPETIGNPVDEPGTLVPNGGPNDRGASAGPAPDAAGGNGGGAATVGQTVRESVQTPRAVAAGELADGTAGATTRPATVPGVVMGEGQPVDVAPASRPAGGGAGGWANVGFVMMEVNGNPIYVDKVLASLERPFETEAKINAPDRFRLIANMLIGRQLAAYKREELEFASAERQLGPEEKAMANGMTIQWRQRKITEAGGSLELAKRRAAADGWDFDDLARQQYRLHLVQLFYQRRVIPLIQVAASNIRSYYNANRDAEFTTHGAAKFRIVKIDPSKYPGGREEAYTRAQEVRKLAEREEFAALAERMSDDPGAKYTRGAVGKDGWVQQGAFRIDEVDKAVFSMRTGQVSDLISGPDGAYYVVKLEDVKQAKVEAFEDPAVQDRIREKLRASQFTALREAHVARLENESITDDKKMLPAAVEMVMLRYPQWAGK